VKLAVISDIHGNRLALEAVLEDIARRGADIVVNLGDVVSGPMDPAGVAALLMAGGFPTVRGNHDRVLGTPESREFTQIDAFAVDALSTAQLAWLEALPPTLVVEDVLLCHGTPRSDRTPWLDGWWDGRQVTVPDEAEVTAAADGFDFPLILCGHTHIPRAVRLRDGRLVVNPGSVGLQINHGAPDARYALIERRDGEWHPEFHLVSYDHDAAGRQAEANGFPLWREAMLGWAPATRLFPHIG